MPFESPDSSQQASPIPPDAAPAPPRTPTGRLQPTSAFPQRNSSRVTPQPAASQEESEAFPGGPGSVAPAYAMPKSAQGAGGRAGGATLPTSASPVTTLPSSPAPPTPPIPATARQGGEESVEAPASGTEGRRHSRSSNRSQSRRGSSAGRASSRKGAGREATQLAELAAIDLESVHVDGSSFRELSGLLLAFGLSVALTQASLWWVVGVDPLGVAPLIEQWLPGLVPTGLRS